MNDLVAIALSNAAWSIPLALAALVVTRRCRQPAVAHAMWLIVLLKLVSPPLIRLPLPELVADQSPQSSDNQPVVANDEPTGKFDGVDRQHEAASGRRILSPTDLPDDVNSASDSDDAPPVGATNATAGFLLDDKQQPKLDVEQRHEIESQTPDQSAKGFASHSPWMFGEPRNDEAAAVPQATEAMLPLPALEPPSFGDLRSESDVAAASSPLQPIAAASSATQPVVESVSEPLVSPATLQSIATGLAVVWAIGSVVWFALAIFRIARFARIVRCASPVDDRLNSRVAELSARIGLGRSPLVRIVSSRVSPLVWPSLKPVLVLPKHLVDTLEGAELDAVIGHELAHLRRRDHWTRWLELAAVGVYWWLPVVWLAKRRLHAAEEACCDAWVLWLLPKHARQYARALLTTIDFLTPPRPAPLLASGFGGATSLHGRFEMILHHKPPRSMTKGVKFGVAAFGMLALPLSVIAQTAPSGAPSADPTKPVKVADNDPNVPSGVPGKTPPSASNDAPPLALPQATPSATPPAKAPPSADNRELPPTGAPSPTTPAASAGAPAAVPPRAQPQVIPADPFDPPDSVPAPSAGAPATPPRARRPVLATPSADLAPPVADPSARPGGVTFAEPVAPPIVHRHGGDDIDARLDRLEKMVASLASEIHAMRRGDTGSSNQPPYGSAIETRPALSSKPPRVATGPGGPNSPVTELGVRTKDKNIVLRLGDRLEAADLDSGKLIWTTNLPGGDQVRSWQVSNDVLQVEGADGISVAVDLNTGAIVGKSTPAGRIAPSPAKARPAVDNANAEKAVAALNEIEQMQIQLQNELDRMQIEEEHKLGKFERIRERAKRELDKIDKTPEDKLAGDERKKAEAMALERLEKIEDEGLEASYQFQRDRSAMQQKLREVESRRTKLMRETAEPMIVQPRR